MRVCACVCVCVRACVRACVCACVGGTKKESQNGDCSQRHKMAESQNGSPDLLEGDITECVKGLQEKKRGEKQRTVFTA